MNPFTKTRLITLAAAILATLLVPAGALADGREVIRDCAQDGDLDGSYSQGELDHAYNNLPSDIDEYSNCREVIERARERGGAGATNNDAGGSGPGGTAYGGGSSGGSYGGSGNDRDELSARELRSRADDPPRADIAGRSTGDVAGALTTGDEAGRIPTPLIVVLVLALLAAMAGGLYALRDRLPAGIVSRLPGPLKG